MGAALVSAVLSVSCAAPLLKLPVGPAMPASDGQSAIEQATAACRTVSSVTLEISVRGSVGGQRLRGRLSAGLAKPASARLEAVASFGQPIFIFVATDADATLLLPRDRRVARGRPDAVLEAVTGVPLDPAALRSVITGCASTPDVAAVRSIGEDWRVTADGPGNGVNTDEIYLRRAGAAAPWQLVTRVHPSASLRAGASAEAWRADYSNFEGGLPRTIHLVSTPPQRFDLQLDLSQVELNTPLGAEAFQVPIPASTEPISVDELRRSGPLGAK